MKRLLFAAPLLFALTLSAVPADAGVGFGADVVNRYVWRGTDFGNAVSVQPGMSISSGNIEVGAWSSWAIIDPMDGANENDLYVSFSSGPIGITLTDYYFPGLTEDDDFFSYSDEDAVHILEVSASLAPDGVPLSALVAYNCIRRFRRFVLGGSDLRLGRDGRDRRQRHRRLRQRGLHYRYRSGLGQRRPQHGQRRLLRLVHPQPRSKKATFLVFGRSF